MSVSAIRQLKTTSFDANPVGSHRAARSAPFTDILSANEKKSGANAGRYADTEEPLLSDLLNDPITQGMMASDGVKQAHLLLVIAEIQARLNGA